MTDAAAGNSVWLLPLGAAWKVRVGSAEAAERLRAALTAAGWKCTPVTAAFDQPQTVLFRASDLNGNRDRELASSVVEVPELQLRSELA